MGPQRMREDKMNEQQPEQDEVLDQGAEAALKRLLSDNPGMTREEALQTLRDLGYV